MGLAEKYSIRYKIEDWEKWEGEWELIEGIPFALASPRPINQILLVKIATLIYESSKSCNNINVAVELDWFISDDTVVKPDLVIFCGDIPQKLNKKPDLILEVLSPSTKIIDEGLKYELYQMQKVKYYIIFYPDEKMFKKYELKNGFFVEKNDSNFIICECDVSIDFQQIVS